MLCFSLRSTKYKIKAAMNKCCKSCSLLSFPFSGISFKLWVASLWNREWNEHLQQDLREQEKITTHQTVAQLGWMDSVCSPWTPSLWESLLSWPGWLPRCSVWPSASQLSPTQPNPVQLIFPVLLFMRWHFYSPIKTFKGPLSKRKECCFNSVVAPKLRPLLFSL